MSGDVGREAEAAPEPTLDELLDNTPEAVAMRRHKAERAEAAAREAARAATPDGRRTTRRKVLLGVLGGVAAVRALAALTGRRGP